MATVLSFIDGNQKSPVKRVIMRARCRGVNFPPERWPIPVIWTVVYASSSIIHAASRAIIELRSPLLGCWVGRPRRRRGANITAIAQHLLTSLTLFRSVRFVSKLAWQINLHGARVLSRGTDALEVAVVGAGAAGIGAATQLAAARISFMVFEARGRVGGRAYTIADNAPFPLDLGCGWLHSADRNPWTRIAAETGFTIDKTLPAWGSQSFNLGFSAEDQTAFALASRRFHERREAVGPKDTDCSAAELLEPDCRFNPLLNALSRYVNGVELNLVSVQDSKRYADSGINW